MKSRIIRFSEEAETAIARERAARQARGLRATVTALVIEAVLNSYAGNVPGKRKGGTK